MPDEQTPQPGALPLGLRTLLDQAAKLANFHRDDALKTAMQLGAALDQIETLKSAHARTIEEHAAALTDRDLGHSQHIERLEADIERLHQTIRDQGKQSLENETLAHGHARAARQELADHVEGKRQGAPAPTAPVPAEPAAATNNATAVVPSPSEATQ